jgi:hypothetical protein
MKNQKHKISRGECAICRLVISIMMMLREAIKKKKDFMAIIGRSI